MSRYKLYTSAEHNRSMIHDTKHDVVAGLEKVETTRDIELLKLYSKEFWYVGRKYFKEEMESAMLVAEWE